MFVLREVWTKVLYIVLMMLELWCAVPWCRQLVARLLARRLVFDPARVTWDLWRIQWHRNMFLSEYLDFTLSVWFHQWSIFIFTLILHLPEGRAGEIGEHSNEATLDRITKPVNVHVHKCVKLYTPYTSYVFRPLMWLSSARGITSITEVLNQCTDIIFSVLKIIRGLKYMWNYR
jgi:hypothetical protein